MVAPALPPSLCSKLTGSADDIKGLLKQYQAVTRAHGPLFVSLYRTFGSQTLSGEAVSTYYGCSYLHTTSMFPLLLFHPHTHVRHTTFNFPHPPHTNYGHTQKDAVTFLLPDGSELTCNKALLVARSPYMAKKFRGSWRNKANVPLSGKGAESSLFRSVMQYCYTDRLAFPAWQKKQVLHLTRVLQLPIAELLEVRPARPILCVHSLH